jgi:amino acid transporter
VNVKGGPSLRQEASWHWKLADVLLGRPLPMAEEKRQRIGPLLGIPVLGLDALSSAAYGPEALLTVLLPMGVAGLRYVLPLTLAIVTVLLAVYLSYRQTIEAYPDGGGAYTVTKENLGRMPSLVAAAALGLDYLLNAAVAVSAGVGAIVSAIPPLLPYTLPLCLGVLLILILVNLRGIRSTGAAFAIPTYLFVAMLALVIGLGIARTVLHGGHPTPVVPPPPPTGFLALATPWLLLRSFANGCTAMTGVEAVSNAVPIFRDSRTVLARRTLGAVVLLLVFYLIGIALLCRAYQVTATPPGEVGYESILSQLAGCVLGRRIGYAVCMGSVFTVLALSANTSFADFPRLSRLLSIDGFLPELFAHRGRRLVFSHGILLLGGLAGLLLLVFGGVTDHLIPLFAVGALTAFTMSQAGMVAHWHRARVHGPRLWINAFGATATGTTALLVAAFKFTEGAWISVLLVLAFIALFVGTRRHHDLVERATHTDAALDLGPPRSPLAVVPMRRWDAISLKALRLAIGLAPEVIAVQVRTDDQTDDSLAKRWDDLVTRPAERLGIRPPRLVVLCSEYRQTISPLVQFVTGLAHQHPGRQVAVLVPEIVEPRWYHMLLQSHVASILKARLLFRGGPQIMVVSTPWYLCDWVGPKGRQ